MNKPQKVTGKARKVSSRSDLLKLLCEAAELEHGIACSYLYAGFSLKRELAEGGMNWQEQQTVRRWASQIYFIASQEMLHLALVWNLTTAIGGTPYYLRPNFPQASKYYPLNAALALEPFGPSSLRRFIQYERPQSVKAERNLKSLLTVAGEDAAEIEFSSIGELYALIESGFRGIGEQELFIGSPDQQMTPALIHFPNIVAVTDQASAVKAIETITHQGEGTRIDRDDSHFGAFVAMLKELLDSKSRGAAFAPARPAMVNPSSGLGLGYGASANAIDEPRAQQVAGLFDSAYSLMLRMLAWSFQVENSGIEAQVKEFCAVAIDFMPRVILPLGEGLMLMPAGKRYPGKTAGPGFGLTRHVMLPGEAKNARKLCRERLHELAQIAAALLENPLPEPVARSCTHLQQIASHF
jgi:Ferritin-like